jgi:hypothetical protein
MIGFSVSPMERSPLITSVAAGIAAVILPKFSKDRVPATAELLSKLTRFTLSDTATAPKEYIAVLALIPDARFITAIN